MFLVFTFKGGKKYFNKQGYLKGMDHFKAHRWSELLFQLVFHGNFGNITLSVGGTSVILALRIMPKQMPQIKRWENK